MKIIKKGKKKIESIWAMTVACTGSGWGGKGCGAILSISEGDLFRTHSYHYDGSHEIYTTFICPCCKEKTDAYDVPNSVNIFLSEEEYLKSKEE